jgi:hypothetical protein
MVLDPYVQQWSALQTVRAAHLVADDVFMAYFALTGTADELHVRGYLAGLLMLSTDQQDLLAHSINESLDATGSEVDGAHYSDEDAAGTSGYEEYLRPLNLTPDGYDFDAPRIGDRSTSAPIAFHPSHPNHTKNPAGTPTGDPEDELDEQEFRRLHALYESGLLDSGPENRFDAITRQARDYFGVSSSSIALITEDSQIIKSVTGPLGQDLPRHLSLCAATIQQAHTLIIEDATLDPKWHNHPLVTGGPQVRFYAGHPLSTVDGWRIGSICLMDDRPRTFTDDDVQALKRFAMQLQLNFWV